MPTAPGPSQADDPRRYAARLTAELAERCGGTLLAAYLRGSAALGCVPGHRVPAQRADRIRSGWRPGRDRSRPDPADLVRCALDQQQARALGRSPGPEAVAFVHSVIEALDAAARA